VDSNVNKNVNSGGNNRNSSGTATSGGVTVWVLASRHTGNQRQLLALARQWPGVAQVRVLDCHLRSNSVLLRGLARLALRLPAGALTTALRQRLLRTDTPFAALGPADVILAKTAHYEWPLALLTAGSERRAVLLGDLRHLRRWEALRILATPATPAPAAAAFMAVLPGAVVWREWLGQPPAAAEQPQPEQTDFGQTGAASTVPGATVFKFTAFKPTAPKPPVPTPVATPARWTLLIGGNARAYHYSTNDWQVLLDAINTLAQRHGIRWLIATSPRTGTAAETLLRRGLAGHTDVVELHCWGQGLRPSLVQCLQGAARVLVFEDSVSMLSEAINTRLPVLALQPLQVPAHDPLITPFVTWHARHQHLCRLPLDALTGTAPEHWIACDFTPVQQCWSDAITDLV
jgi:hypothetical protein